MSEKKKLTTVAGSLVVDNQNVVTAGPRGRARSRTCGFGEAAHSDREVIPERRMHAKGWAPTAPSP